MGLANLCKDFWHNWYELKNNVESHTGILTGIGIVTGLAGTVAACVATSKITTQADDHKKLVDDTKANCAEAQLDEKQTKKEVMKAYRHIGVDYVKKFWPAVGLLTVGYALIFRAHSIEVARNEALMTAYIGLEQFMNKYRARVVEAVGEEQEAKIFSQAQADQAEENIIGEYSGEFINGSYLLMNESCEDYQMGCPQANDFTAMTVQTEIKNKYDTGVDVYVNDVMRAFGHKEVAGGWSWIWRKGLTEAPDFKLHDMDFNPDFARGYGYDRNNEPILKIYLNGCVHISKRFSAEFRQYLRENEADGGVMGGKLGRDQVIIG